MEQTTAGNAELPVFEQVRYDEPIPNVARVTMARPDARNAQGLQMTYELNAAFDHAAQDDNIKVIILAGDGPHFSAGHDLGGDRGKTWRDFPVIGTWGGFDLGGAEGRYAREKEIYLEMTERWRNLPKPMIAQVQGKCIAGGLMLAWCCDLIVAGRDAQFRDPTLEMGVCGAEFFMHPWEIGVRQAKEWLFTSDWLSADDAKALGMVNRVVPEEELEEFTLNLAAQIARKPAFALKATKEAINHVQDVQGRRNAMMHVFSLHQLCHANNQMQWQLPVHPNGVSPAFRESLKKRDEAAKKQTG
ncbi:MAG: enoyl-CoA hydratase [Sneathiella sp.]|mgnify:FL=1|nr:enoyl-CoA hydratase [Sneathiella sp.]MAL79998.1 enoyl-CoA hydratase [Sneathiella sp.]